jgi:hypothetical protein
MDLQRDLLWRVGVLGLESRDFEQWVKVGRFGGKRLGIGAFWLLYISIIRKEN